MGSAEEREHDAPDPVEQELREVGERVRERLRRRGAELVDSAQEERTRAAMRSIVRAPEETPARPRDARRRALIALVAAAALVAVFLQLRGSTPGPVPLGPGHVRILAPIGRVSSFSAFTWESSFPAGTRYEIVVTDEHGHDLVKEKLGELRWSPPDEARLPARIRWTLSALDALEEAIVSDSQEAWRLPPSGGVVPPVQEPDPGRRLALSREEALARIDSLRPALLDGLLPPEEVEEFALSVLDLGEAASAELLSEARRALPPDARPELAGRLAVEHAYALRREGSPEARALLGAAAASMPQSTERHRALVVLTDMCFEAGDVDQALEWDRQAQRALRALEGIIPPAELVHARLTGLHSELTRMARLRQLEEVPARLDEMRALVAQVADESRSAWAAVEALQRLDGYFRTNRFPEMITVARRALAEEELTPQYRGLVEMRLGTACSYVGDAPAALAAFERVAANGEVAALERGQAETRMAEILHEGGKSEEARAHLARARALLGEPAAPLDLRLFLAAIESKVLGPDLGRLRELFAAFLAEIARTPLQRSGVGFLGSLPRREFLQQLMLAEMAAAPGEPGTLAALDVLFRAQAHSTLVRTLLRPGDEVGSVRDLRERLLDERAGVLVLFPGRSSRLVFALARAGCTVAPGPSYPEASALRLELARWESLAPETRARQGLPRAAAELARRLLPEPIRARVERWSEITVVGRDLLGPFSLELLPLADGALLGERLAVGYLPSLPLGILLARRAAPADGQRRELALVLGTDLPDGLPADGFPDIPYVPQHRTLLDGGFAAESVVALEGRSATAAALLGQDWTARCWLVVAHGFLDEGRERTPTLLLSDADGSSGRLGSLEVAHLRAPPLVFLAACWAGAGPQRPGDDSAAHLGGAFLAAGSEVVLLPPGKIDYADVLALAPHFWRHLRAGESPARALCAARKAARAERASSDPAFGLLHVVGMAHRPVY